MCKMKQLPMKILAIELVGFVVIFKAVCANIVETDKSCNEDETCIRKENCPSFMKKYQRYLNQRNKELQKELVGEVCNKKEKGVCCSKRNTLPSPPSCGMSTSLELPKFVVGGNDTNVGDFPFLALLGYPEKKKIQLPGRVRYYFETKYVCAGTLINEWYVLTAAHCQGKNPKTKISKLRLGQWRLEGYGHSCPPYPSCNGDLPDVQDFDIQEKDITVHENYEKLYQTNHNDVVNDIALIKLPRPAQLNIGVQIACLPLNIDEILNHLNIEDPVTGLVGRRPTVVGWGITHADQLVSWNGVGSRTQQYLQVPVLSKNQCKAKKRFSERETQICAGGELGRDSCRGDSGGGLYIQRTDTVTHSAWYLIGIVSFGSKDCGNGVPGIYTRVSEYISWINNNLK